MDKDVFSGSTETEGISEDLNTSPFTRQVQEMGYFVPYEIRGPTETLNLSLYEKLRPTTLTYKM